MSFLTDLLAADVKQAMPVDACAALLRKLESQFKAGPDHPEKPMRIQGQDELVHRLTMAVVMNEHVLLEGLPGVAKTTAVELLARDTGLSHRRIQFVPDMQPSDLVGREQINLAALSGASNTEQGNTRFWENGPLFQNMVIADEINRAPSKIQAALLESMAERSITPFGKPKFVIRSKREWSMWLRSVLAAPAYRKQSVWGSFWSGVGPSGAVAQEALAAMAQSLCEQDWDAFGPEFPWADRSTSGEGTLGATPIDLRNPHDAQFTVFATMNPIEQEGTYPLSEAQTDRFCFKTIVRYPSYEALQAVTRMINPPRKGADPDVAIAAREAEADEAMRRSLYFFRRCREAMYGSPGRQEGSIFEQGLLRGGDGKSGGALDLITRVVFYSHIRTAETGSRRDQQLAELLKDPEQVERQARLLHEDRAYEHLLEEDVWQFIKSGASPRAQMFLAKASVCELLMDGTPSSPVGPEHVRRIAHDVLRHRVRLNVQAHVRGIRTDDIVDTLLHMLTAKPREKKA